MGEMNERDLEQVSGGAAGKEFDIRVWLQANCAQCAKIGDCSGTVRIAAMKEAELAARQGKEYHCPDMR